MDHFNYLKKCIVKVVVNPQFNSSFNLKFDLFPKSSVNLKINLASVNELEYVLSEIKRYFTTKYNFDVQFNWKNVPKKIKQNRNFRLTILEIFHSGIPYEENDKTVKLGDDIEKIEKVEINFNELAKIIRSHMVLHGAAPNFKSSKINIINKRHNYIKTILNNYTLTVEDTEKISSLVFI